MRNVSTYVEIYGEVHLDPPAVAMLMSRPAWDWISEPEEFTLCTNQDGSITLTFDGRSIRNIGRHLDTDLAITTLLGTVTGRLIIDCTDGTNVRRVVEFSPGNVLYGTSECFNTALEMRHCEVASFNFESSALPIWYFLTAIDETEPATIFVPEAAFILCGCNGWVDDEPECRNLNEPAKQPTSLTACVPFFWVTPASLDHP